MGLGFLRRRCPICGTATSPHCPRLTCDWHLCPRNACRARIDFARSRGFQILPGEIVKGFRLTAPPPPAPGPPVPPGG